MLYRGDEAHAALMPCLHAAGIVLWSVENSTIQRTVHVQGQGAKVQLDSVPVSHLQQLQVQLLRKRYRMWRTSWRGIGTRQKRACSNICSTKEHCSAADPAPVPHITIVAAHGLVLGENKVHTGQYSLCQTTKGRRALLAAMPRADGPAR